MEIKNEPSMEEAILVAAERLFLEKGYALTSTTEIARQVGCNQALVHYYFRTKENLFNTIFEQKFRLFFRHIFEMENMDNLSFEDKLKHIIESHFDMLRENPRMPMLVISELTRRPEQVAVLKEKLKDIPQQLVQKMNVQLQAEIEAGRIRETTLMDMVFTMVSLNISLFLLLPIAAEIASLNQEQQRFMIQHRREEHVKTILNSLVIRNL